MRESIRLRLVSYPLLLAGGYVAWCALLYARQDAMIFPRDVAGPGGPASAIPFGGARWTIDLEEGGTVEAWFLPADAMPFRPSHGRKPADDGLVPAAPTRRPAVIYAHGNAELIDDCLDVARQYTQWGVHVLLPEFRGYGRSGGAPSEAAIKADLLRFHDRLAARAEVDPQRIFYHGRSLGGAVVAGLAEARRPAVLILESTFTSLIPFCHRYGVPAFLCRHPFRTDRVVGALDCPILLFHGTTDDIIPAWHGRRLHALAPRSEFHEMPSGHNDFPGDFEAFWRHVARFLERHGLLPDDGARVRARD